MKKILALCLILAGCSLQKPAVFPPVPPAKPIAKFVPLATEEAPLNRVVLSWNNSSPSVTLGWDASSSSGVTGYYIYQGGLVGVYTNKYDAGNVAQFTVTNLAPGGCYYFVATAYNNILLESEYSNEVAYTVPSNTVSVFTSMDLRYWYCVLNSDIDTEAALTYTSSSRYFYAVKGTNRIPLKISVRH